MEDVVALGLHVDVRPQDPVLVQEARRPHAPRLVDVLRRALQSIERRAREVNDAARWSRECANQSFPHSW